MEEPYCLFAKEIICMYFRCSLDVVEIWKEKNRKENGTDRKLSRETGELLAAVSGSFSILFCCYCFCCCFFFPFENGRMKQTKQTKQWGN